MSHTLVINAHSTQVACPVCDASMDYFGTGDYYLPQTARIMTPLFHCRHCDALCRPLDERDLFSHYDRCSYTDPKLENRFLEQRSHFFRYLISLAMHKAGHRPASCLDFGCSYGHLLLLLRDMGCDVCGVEVCQQARDVCRKHGLDVYGTLDEIDSSRKFELITLIDSLYYVPDPQIVMRKLRARLADNGMLLIRVANRNWLLRLLKIAAHAQHFGNWLGDAVVGYSNSTLATLFRRTGFRIESTCYWDRGKHLHSLPRRTFYWVSSAVSSATQGTVVISPGIIVLATKQA